MSDASGQAYGYGTYRLRILIDPVKVDELDVLIHVANYENLVNGGILSTLRFGSQASISYVRWYSIGFQLMVFLVLLHALYAPLFSSRFIPGNRPYCLYAYLISLLFRRLASAPAGSMPIRLFTAALLAYSGFVMVAPTPWIRISTSLEFTTRGRMQPLTNSCGRPTSGRINSSPIPPTS